MKSKYRLARFLTPSALLSLALCAATAQGQTSTYSLEDIGAIPAVSDNYTMSVPAGINNNGQVIGSNAFHALFYDKGVVTDLGTLPGGTLSDGLAINSLGDVSAASGFTSDNSSWLHAALFASDGSKIDLNVLLGWGPYSYGYGINDSKQIVGSSGPVAPNTSTRAFIWDATNGLRDLGTLGGQYAQAFSINNAGVATGAAQVAAGGFHAFTWDAVSGMRDLGAIGGDSSSGIFVNQSGHIVGNSTINAVDGRTHAFFYDGTMKDLGSLGSSSTISDISSAFGVNINDDVVGSSYRPFTGGSLYQTAFIYSNGVMSELETMVDSSGTDYRLLAATGINDLGQIVVQAHKISTNTDTAVLLTPTTAATDTVTITAATYVTRRQTLQVQATDSDKTATLQVFVTSTNTLVGSLTKTARGYKGTFTLSSNPGSITVKSSLGGSATAAVTSR
jgi:probable HAF family extracellular repeat protein